MKKIDKLAIGRLLQTHQLQLSKPTNNFRQGFRDYVSRHVRDIPAFRNN